MKRVRIEDTEDLLKRILEIIGMNMMMNEWGTKNNNAGEWVNEFRCILHIFKHQHERDYIHLKTG